MSKSTSFIFSRSAVVVSLFVLGCIDLLRVGGCVLGLLIGGPAIPKPIFVELAVFVAGGIAIVTFGVWKLGVVIVSWIDMTLILTHRFAWDGFGVKGFFEQYTVDLIFFIAANLAAIAYQPSPASLGAGND